MFNFTYRLKSGDLWQLSMYYIYGSLVGLCNVIFTAAAFVLLVVRWSAFGIPLRCVLIFCCCIFTVFQPLAVWLRARRQAASFKEDTHLAIDSQGIHVTQGDKKDFVPWKKIKKISKKPTMIVVFSDTTHGYVLMNRTLSSSRDEFYRYAAARMDRR